MKVADITESRNTAAVNTTVGSSEIKKTRDKLNSVFNEQQSAKTNLKLKEEKIAKSNSEEQKQVQEIKNALDTMQSEYSDSITASNNANSLANNAQSNASSLKAIANQTPKTIQIPTGKTDPKTQEPIMKEAPNSKYEKIQAQAQAAQAQANELRQQAKTLQEKTEELKVACNDIKTTLGGINNEEDDDNDKEDLELEELKKAISDYDNEIEKLNQELEQQEKLQDATGVKAQKTNDEGKYNITNSDGTTSTVSINSDGSIQITDRDDNETTMNFDKNNKLTNTTIKNQDGSIVTIKKGKRNSYNIQKHKDGTLVYEQKKDKQENISYSVYDKQNAHKSSENSAVKTKYDRTDRNRSAIAVHDDNLDIVNGFDNENEKSGILLDLDVYHDRYGDKHDRDDSEDFEKYKKEAGQAISQDLIDYYGINAEDKNAQKQLKTIYRQIAAQENINVGSEEDIKNMSAQEYNDKVSKILAQRTWDGNRNNDYVDLNKTELKEIIEYDRTDRNRSAIAVHDDNLDIVNGFDNENEKSGILLDLDVYHDRYGDKYDRDDSEDFEKYKKEAGQAISQDLIDYYGINAEDKNAQKQLKTIYKQIAAQENINVGSEEDIKNMNAQEYNDKVSKILAQRTWDGNRNNDYVDLNKTELKEIITKYDRSDSNRNAIIDHDNLKTVEHGLDNEEDFTGIQLDLDKYFDKNLDLIRNEEEDKYKETFAKNLRSDLADYYNIDTKDKDSKEKLKNVYQQIAYKAGISVDNYDDDEEYISKVSAKLAALSNDDSFVNDYVNLNGVSTKYNEQMAVTKEEDESKGQTIIDFAYQYLGMGNQDEFEEPGAWCAAFVRYVMKNCGTQMPEWYEDMPDWASHACRYIRDAADEADAIVDTDKAEPGDIVLFDWDYRGEGDDHIGIITKVEGNTVYTIEGNAGAEHIVKEKTYTLPDGRISYYCKMV